MGDEDQKSSVYESYMQRDFFVPCKEDNNMTSPMNDLENGVKDDSVAEHLTAAEVSTRRGEVTMSGRSTIDESEAFRPMPTVVEQAPSATMFEHRKQSSDQACLNS